MRRGSVPRVRRAHIESKMFSCSSFNNSMPDDTLASDCPASSIRVGRPQGGRRSLTNQKGENRCLVAASKVSLCGEVVV